MKILKLDLMTVLFVVVLIGVVVTMTSQANDQMFTETGVANVSTSAVGSAYTSKSML